MCDENIEYAQSQLPSVEGGSSTQRIERALDDLADATQQARWALRRHPGRGVFRTAQLKDASLPSRLSPHSFRVTTITDLLEQGVPLEDVQRLAGHADPRTTRLYDRRQKKITRNIVERISI
jgi:site-specific recombinase XerD